MLDDILQQTDTNDDENVQYATGRKNVLVTGGAGFIGSNLCQLLVKNNNVICIDNYLTGEESKIDHLLQLPNFKFIKHDITEPLDLNQTMEGKTFKVEFQGIQEIYHAASPTHFGDNVKYPLETSLANSLGTKNVLDWAVKHKSKVVLFSTSLVYGNLYGENLINESMMGIVDPIGDRNCYIEGKRYAESLSVNYRDKHNLDVKIARIFNTYGPKMRQSDNLLIPTLIEKALKNEPIEINGTGDELISACFVSDVIDGIMKLMQSDEKGPMNLGSDVRITVDDLVKKITQVCGSASQVSYSKEQGITVTKNIPDLALAKDKLEWVPMVNLDQGMKKTIEDFKLTQKRVKTFA